MKLPKNVLYYGKDEPLPEQQTLRAGPLSLIYEAGDLRYIRLRNHEILRRVYVAVRDYNWGTVTPILSNVEMDIGQDSFKISYDVENKQDHIDFFWRGTITGDANGQVKLAMDGEARSTFRRNRIGFCILHPMECAGVRCQIEHVNGTIEQTVFPHYIGPQLVIDGTIHPVHPFDNMRAVTYDVVPGLQAEIRFAGETFEMEDQRNWTDASYKTYGTPLALPFPIEVEAGTKISQSVTLTLKGQLTDTQSTRTNDDTPVFLVKDTGVRTLPQIGLGVAHHGQPLSQKELARLKALNLSHLKVGLRLSESNYEAELRQAAAEANELGIKLEVALFLSDAAEAELQAFSKVVEQIKPPVWAWLIFHQTEKTTSEKWIALARQLIQSYDSSAKIGSGTNVFFTELNCNRPPIQAMDLVCYSLNPQVHAFDNLSLVETLAAQAATVESARQFCGDLPITVTPVTLKMRFNPHATGPEPEPEPGQLTPQVEVRQMSLFGAGWTAGSLKYLSESDTHSLTYYETTGWRGIMETEAGSPVPEKFQSFPGGVYPLYHVLADVGEFAGGEIVTATSNQTLKVDGLALRKDSTTRVILVNLSPEPQQVSIQGLDGQVQIRVLDESNVENAMQSPEEFRTQAGILQQTNNGTLRLSLQPYAVARIDGNS